MMKLSIIVKRSLEILTAIFFTCKWLEYNAVRDEIYTNAYYFWLVGIPLFGFALIVGIFLRDAKKRKIPVRILYPFALKGLSILFAFLLVTRIGYDLWCFQKFGGPTKEMRVYFEKEKGDPKFYTLWFQNQHKRMTSDEEVYVLFLMSIITLAVSEWKTRLCSGSGDSDAVAGR